jgi:tRNA(fMet)-specific endonuclease VapC
MRVSVLLLDTNVVSFFINEHSLAEEYLGYLQGHTAAVSFMTIAELYEGAYRAGWGAKRFRKLHLALDHYVVFDFTIEVCQRWGEIRYQRRRQPISTDDAWIAATALVYRCPLMTHNPADFRGIPKLQIISALNR